MTQRLLLCKLEQHILEAGNAVYIQHHHTSTQWPPYINIVIRPEVYGFLLVELSVNITKES